MSGEMDVRHNEAHHRFEAGVEPHLARLNYRVHGSVVDIIHTEVPAEYQGQGLASKLAKAALEWVRSQGLRVTASCSYVHGYLAKHPEYSDLL